MDMGIHQKVGGGKSANEEEEKTLLVQRFRGLLSTLRAMPKKIHGIARKVDETTQKMHRKRLNEIERIYRRNMKSAENRFHQTIEDVEKEIDKIERGFDFPQKEWADASWQTFRPPKSLDSHPLINIGRIRKKSTMFDVQTPLMLPVLGHNNVLIKAAGAQKEKAVDLLQIIAMRMLVSIPAGKLKFTFIDPVGHGKYFGRFMDLPDALTGGRIWGEKRHIEEQLLKFSEHIRQVNQKYLKNRFKNIEDYNKEVKEIEEAYRVLMVSDFPEGFDTESARRLVSIAENGVHTGVYVLVMVDEKKKNPYDYNPGDLERKCLNIAYQSDSTLSWVDSPFTGCVHTQGSLPGDATSDLIIRRVARASERVRRVKVPFKEIVRETTKKLWQNDSSAEISIPVGKTGAKIQFFTIGRDEHHALIAGKTGYGKSVFLHNLIISICLHYSPHEIEFYLIDFKEGVEFMKYATHQLPHARVVAVETEREFGYSILKKLEMEFKRRSEIFKSQGGDISKLTDYNRKNPDAKLSRILLIVDEFQQFFTEDDNLAMQTLTLLDRLVKQGRNVGINILLASQTMDRAIFSKGTANQMGLRLAFQCTDDDSRLILGEANPEAKMLTRPGEAIYNDKTGAIEANNRFQGSWFSNDEIGEWLDTIREEAQKNAYTPPQRLLVFNGRTPGDITRNTELENVIRQKQWTRPVKEVYAWLGESIAVKPDACAVFKRQSGSNLLFVGMNENAILSMLLSTILGVIAQQDPARARFYFINPLGQDHPWHGFFKGLELRLDQHTAKVVDIQKKIPKMIEEIHQKLKERLENEGRGFETSIYVYIVGVHRATILRKRGYDFSEGATMLEEIFQDGPDLGIHTLMWADANKSLDRVFDRAVNHFDARVVQYMNPDDSSLLIESPLASKLNEYQAFLFDFNRPDSLEKFKPYEMTDQEIFKNLQAEIRKKEIPS